MTRRLIMCSAFRQQWFARVALSASETAHETMAETEADTMTIFWIDGGLYFDTALRNARV